MHCSGNLNAASWPNTGIESEVAASAAARIVFAMVIVSSPEMWICVEISYVNVAARSEFLLESWTLDSITAPPA